MKFPRLSRAFGGSWGINPSAKSVALSEEELSELDWVPVSIPKIDHAEELQKMRDHIAANPDGEGGPSIFDDHYHFLNTNKPSSGKPTPEQLAADTIRAKVAELNDAIKTAEKLKLHVELHTLAHNDIALGETSIITATISKTL